MSSWTAQRALPDEPEFIFNCLRFEERSGRHPTVDMHLQARQGGAWDQFTSAAASLWNDAFPTGNSGNQADDQGSSSGPSTIYSTVYETQTPSGWTGTALTTIPPATKDSASTTAASRTTSASAQTTASASSGDVLQTASARSDSTTASESTLPTVINSSSLSSSPKTLVVAETTSTPSIGRLSPTTTAATSTATTITADATSSSTGPSAGAKAGIAFGVLAAVFVVFVALYLLFTRRKRQMEEKRRTEDDEKHNGPFADSNAIPGTTSTAARAPRLSLRPVTQFLPNLGNQTQADRRASRGAVIPMTNSRTQNVNRALPGTPSTPPATSPSTNPFGNDAACSPSSEEASPTANSFSPIENVVGAAITTNSPPRTSPAAAASNATMAAGAAVGLARKTSLRKDRGPKPLDLTMPRPQPLGAVPPSPAGTEFSMHSVAPGQNPGPSGSAAAIAAAGGPAQSAVHRVQLDFKPTLEDEMELRAGQLVRLLHEYDDGWVSLDITATSPCRY